VLTKVLKYGCPEEAENTSLMLLMIVPASDVQT